MPRLIVPAVVCRFLEDVEDVTVAVFRPFDEEADGLKDLLFLPDGGGKPFTGLIIEGPGSWWGRRYESLESDMGLEMEEGGNLLVKVNDVLSSVERGEGDLVDGGGCVVVCHW